MLFAHTSSTAGTGRDAAVVNLPPDASVGAALPVMWAVVACRAGFHRPFFNSIDDTAVASIYPALVLRIH